MTDSLSQLLAELPQTEPDRTRVDRVRSRCHAMLARHLPRPVEHRRFHRAWETLVAGLGGIYLVEVILQALELSGVL